MLIRHTRDHIHHSRAYLNSTKVAHVCQAVGQRMCAPIYCIYAMQADMRRLAALLLWHCDCRLRACANAAAAAAAPKPWSPAVVIKFKFESEGEILSALAKTRVSPHQTNIRRLKCCAIARILHRSTVCPKNIVLSLKLIHIELYRR